MIAKKKLLFCFVSLFLISLFGTAVFAEDDLCQGHGTFHYGLKALNPETFEDSKAQHPDFIEDELLLLGEFIVENDTNCTMPESTVRISFKTPNRSIERFTCGWQLNIPELSPFGKYSSEYLERRMDEIESERKTVYVYRYYYKDSGEDEYHVCPIKMGDVGAWEVNIEISGGVNGYSYRKVRADGVIELGDSDFKVRSKPESTQITLTEESIKQARGIAIVAIFLTLFVFIIEKIVEWYFKARKEIALLRQLEIEIEKNKDLQSTLASNEVVKQNVLLYKPTNLVLKSIVTNQFFVKHTSLFIASLRLTQSLSERVNRIHYSKATKTAVNNLKKEYEELVESFNAIEQMMPQIYNRINLYRWLFSAGIVILFILLCAMYFVYILN